MFTLNAFLYASFQASEPWIPLSSLLSGLDLFDSKILTPLKFTKAINRYVNPAKVMEYFISIARMHSPDWEISEESQIAKRD